MRFTAAGVFPRWYKELYFASQGIRNFSKLVWKAFGWRRNDSYAGWVKSMLPSSTNRPTRLGNSVAYQAPSHVPAE